MDVSRSWARRLRDAARDSTRRCLVRRVSLLSLLCSIVCPAVLAGLLAIPAAADTPAAWDQARTTSIAKQLAKACDDFYNAVEKQPNVGEVGAGSAEMGFSMERRARTLREQSLALADHLEKGKGEPQTRDEFRSLREIADDVEESAQRSPLDDPTMAAWAKVADGMRQLAPYYGVKASAE
jgi:hypothetical protein